MSFEHFNYYLDDIDLPANLFEGEVYKSMEKMSYKALLRGHPTYFQGKRFLITAVKSADSWLNIQDYGLLIRREDLPKQLSEAELVAIRLQF